MLNDAIRLALPPGILAQPPAREQSERVSFTNNLIVCEVHDVVAYANSYIVKGAGTSRMVATVMMDCSGLPVGARDASMIVPGAKVLCYTSDDYFPIIIGVLASPVGSPVSGAPDSITAASKVGLYGDPAHKDIVASNQNCFVNFADGRPVDNLPGDWGKFNELGMGVFLGKLMAFLRASDICKLETFYLDNLMRMFAYNYQQYTAGSELESFNDEGEWTEIMSHSPYPWERLGFPSPNTTPSLQENTSPLDGKFGIEPQDVRQLAIWRMREMRGYLAEGYRRYVAVPVLDESVAVNVYGNMPYKGVFEEHLGLDGAYKLRTAKSWLVEKSVYIPIPTEQIPRDNPEGDTDFENPAGLGEAPLTEFPEPSIDRLDDQLTYEEQKYNSQGTDLRALDWKTNEDSLIGDFTNEQDPFVPYNTFDADTPTKATQTIDHRKDVRYYKGRARIGLTEDGGFIIEDAWGSTIRSSNGNIEISCPGDVITRTGRTVQTWAGKDVVTKAQNSVDISSSTEDVRIKAERNMLVLGGNSGKGGVLVENRAEEGTYFPGMDADGVADPDTPNVGGLLLKCSRGTFSILSKSMHLRATDGDFVIDADGGAGDIVMFGNNLKKYLKTSSIEAISGSSNELIEDGSVDDVSVVKHSRGVYDMVIGSHNISTTAMTLINRKADNSSTNLQLKGNVTIEGTVSAERVSDGGSVNINASTYNGSLTKTQSAAFTDIGTEAEEHLRADTSIGAASSFIGVAFRSTSNLSLGNMKIHEAPWQRRFRLTASVEAGNDVSTSFTETSVYDSIDDDGQERGSETMPFPGYEAWTEGSDAQFVQYDPKFYTYDATGGKPKPKPDEDEDDPFDLDNLEDAVEGPFEGTYPINS